MKLLKNERRTSNEKKENTESFVYDQTGRFGGQRRRWMLENEENVDLYLID